MNVDSENLIPARRPSGRLSKPSMELLVDNQRLLAQYIEPRKKRKVEIKKFVEEISSPSNFSEKSSLSSIEKPKSRKRLSLAVSEKNMYKEDKISPSKSDKIIRHKISGKNESQDVNGNSKYLENNTKSEADGNNIINRTAYVSIEINDLMMKNVKSPEKSSDIDNKSEDDLPLSKIYPDFKPQTTPTRNESAIETRDTSTLPPKKKIKFVNFFELNGNSSNNNNIINKQSISSPTSKIVPKLKLVLSPTKSNVMSMPKIPKKSLKISNGDSDATNHSSSSPMATVVMSSATTTKSSPLKNRENFSAVSELNTDPVGGSIAVPTCVSPSPPVIDNQNYVDTTNTKRCIRPSCTNIAIEDFQWDMEFCSPDCAIMYSKFLFSEWVHQRKDLVVIE